MELVRELSESSDYQRREAYFSGRVQGVGFRYTTRTISERYKVTGFVRNLIDGRVEVVVEGSASELDEFLADIQRTMNGHVDHCQINRSNSTGEFDQFSVRYS